MNYTIINASKPGTPVPRIDIRVGDSKIFLIDCSTLICTNELIFGNVNNNTTELNLSDKRTSQGKFIKFRVSGGPISVPYADYLINFSVNTTMTNVLAVPVSIRVHSN